MMIKTHVVVFFINRLIFTIGKQRVVLVPAADGELERVGRFGFGQRQWRLQRPLTAQIPREACPETLHRWRCAAAALLHCSLLESSFQQCYIPISSNTHFHLRRRAASSKKRILSLSWSFNKVTSRHRAVTQPEI